MVQLLERMSKEQEGEFVKEIIEETFPQEGYESLDPPSSRHTR